MDFLDQVDNPDDVPSLIVLQQSNLIEQLEIFREKTGKEGLHACVGIIDVQRSPHKSVDSQIKINSTNTMRTNAHGWWILPSPDLEQTFGPMGRYLNRCKSCEIDVFQKLDGKNCFEQISICMGLRRCCDCSWGDWGPSEPSKAYRN